MLIRSLFVGPAKLYLALAFLWLLLYVSSPITYDVEFTLVNLLTLVAIQAALFVGFFISQRLYRNCHTTDSYGCISNEIKEVVLPLVFYLGCFGFFLKMYTLFFIKGAPLTLNPIAIRLALLNEIGAGQGGALSILAAIFFPFCLIYIPLYFKANNLGIVLKVMLAIVIIFVAFDAVLSGGGTSITISFLYIVFSTKVSRFSTTKILILLLGIFLIFALAGWMWLERLDTMFGGVAPYLKEFNGKWIANYSASFTNNYDKDSLIWNAYYIYSWIGYYFVHGYIELVHLTNEFNLNNVTFGINQTYLFFKFFGMLGMQVPSADELASINIVQGHYQTFWGLAFLDFGYLFLVEVILLGWVCSYLFYSKKRGAFTGIVFYPYIQTQIIYSFLSNSLNGQISYLIVSGLLLVTTLKVIKWWKYREKSLSA